MNNRETTTAECNECKMRMNAMRMQTRTTKCNNEIREIKQVYHNEMNVNVTTQQQRTDASQEKLEENECRENEQTRDQTTK
jgi:hypothetical protein